MSASLIAYSAQSLGEVAAETVANIPFRLTDTSRALSRSSPSRDMALMPSSKFPSSGSSRGPVRSDSDRFSAMAHKLAGEQSGF